MAERLMKDTQIEWASTIPYNWDIMPNKRIMKKVKNICDKYEGENIISLSMDGVKIRDLEAGGKMPTTFDGYQKVTPGNLLMCLFDYDVTPRCIGLIKDEGLTSPAYSQFVMLNNNYAPYYYYYYLMLDNSKELLHLAKNLRHSFTEEQLGEIKTPVPPVEEQTRIANFLDKKVSEIDNAIDKTKQSVEEYKKLKQSIITEAVIKGLNPDVEMKNSGIEWAEKIPSHWQIMPNKHVMKKIKNICEKYQGENIISLSMDGVKIRDLDAGGKMPMTFDGYQFVYPNNLLMCLFDYDVTPRCIGLIKDYGVTSPAYSQFMMKNGNLANFYYYYYLMIDNTKELLHLAKNLRHSFTEEQLGVINTPVPPVEEQKIIADYLDAQCSKYDELISKKEQFITELEQYKKSLIYEYVTGKKEVA